MLVNPMSDGEARRGRCNATGTSSSRCAYRTARPVAIRTLCDNNDNTIKQITVALGMGAPGNWHSHYLSRGGTPSWAKLHRPLRALAQSSGPNERQRNHHRQHQHREAPQRQQQERPVDVRSRVRRDPIKAGRNDGRPCRTDGGAIAHTTGNLRGTSSRNASFEQTLREWQSKHPRVATPARRNPSIPAPHVNAQHGGAAERRQGRCPRRHSHAHRT